MNGEATQQVFNCETCKKPREHQYFCNACQHQLCQRSECLRAHLGEGHDVVQFESRVQFRQKQMHYEVCQSHTDKVLNMFCRSCHKKICDGCVRLNHRDVKKHLVVGINYVLADKRKTLTTYTSILKCNAIPRFVKGIQYLDEEIADSVEAYNVKRDTIVKTLQLWQDEMGRLANRLFTDLQCLQDLHLTHLREQRGYLEKTLIQMGDLVRTNEKRLQSPLEIIEHEVGGIEKYLVFPEIITYDPPEFSVGTLSTLLDAVSKNLRVTYSPRYSASSDSLCAKSCVFIGELTRLTEKIHKKEKIRIGIQNEMILVSSFPANHNRRHFSDICCSFSDFAWIYDQTSSKILKVTENGDLSIEKKIEDMSYITAHRNGEIFFTSEKSKSLNKMSFSENCSQTVQVVTMTEWIPYGLTLTKTNDILICERRQSRGRVVRYSTQGHQLKVIEKCLGTSLFQRPERVTENKNGDICVTDTEIPGSLVVVNNLGEFNFRYTPDDQYPGSTYRHLPLLSEYKPFIPSGIATDRYGNILVSDSQKLTIHLLDQWGQFVQFLSSKHVKVPTALSVDDAGKLWISDGKLQIKIVKYLNSS